MAEAALTAVLSKLGELAVSEAKILLQVGDEIILLRDQLEWLQAFVRDADRRRRAGRVDGLTRVWVRQTRDVAFEAEDALDDFFYEEVLGPKSQGYGRGRRILHRYFTCFFTQIVVRHGLSDRIKIIKSRLEQISQNQKGYNIEHTPTAPSSPSTTAIAAWRDDLENAVGFDEDVKIIRNMLSGDGYITCGNSPHRPIFISIVGESGAGKNTLAKIIYREMSRAMRVVIWYNMEPGSSTADLLTEVYQRAAPFIKRIGGRLEDGEGQICVDVSDQVRTLLGRQKYMLILGGITSKTVLNTVRASLPEYGHGSVMLILDTENEEVGWHANAMNPYRINGVHLLTRLDQARSEELFLWKVSRKGQYEKEATASSSSRNPNLSDGKYSRLVHDITGGYPIAIVLLAGLLRFKEKPVEWDAVLQQLLISGSETQAGGGNVQVQQANNNICGTRRAMEMIFWASFEDLPNDLKSCFLYFTSYPKSLSHSADTVVRMWIAEGFIKQPEENGKTKEELGHDYLKVLALRCLVEVEGMKPGGGIELVRVHKSIMGFLLSEVHESGFMEIINDLQQHAGVPPSVRRLSVQCDNYRQCIATFGNMRLPKMRSFIWCIIDKVSKHSWYHLEFLRWSKFLRVVSIQGLRLKELPDMIGDMINLRYLRIDCASLRHLPCSIGRLPNLQTLDISNTQVKEIDHKFWKIKTLRHVLASTLALPIQQQYCQSNEEGNSSGGDGLQTLHGVMPITSQIWSAGNCPLDKMTSLKSLEMHGFEYKKHGGPAFTAALGNMHMLGHLNLQGDKIPLCVFTDPSLRSLQTMVLQGQVDWDSITAEVLRKVRSNLVQLTLGSYDMLKLPWKMREQLRNILICKD